MPPHRQKTAHGFREFTTRDARDWMAEPGPTDHKYTRGVLGIITGSDTYPGAAVISVDAALHTGVGMVRYLGPARQLVLARRPEAVTESGRVDAWLLGSGTNKPDDPSRDAAAHGAPLVLDAGALTLATSAAGPAVITPHAGELARILGLNRADIGADPASAVLRAVDELGVTIMLKGHTTLIADPHGSRWSVTAESSWLATAGTGDALAGILGALTATQHQRAAAEPGALAALAATASRLHVTAADIARGPFTVLQLCAAIPEAVRHCLESDTPD